MRRKWRVIFTARVAGTNVQTVGVQLSSLLTDFLDETGQAAPALRQRIAAWSDAGRVPYEDWLDCLDQLANELQTPALGLFIGSLIRPSHLGLVGELAMCCSTLGEVLLCLQRYHGLIYDGNAQKVSFEGRDVVLSWQEDYGRFHQAVSDISLAMFVRMGYLLVGPRWSVRRVFLGDAGVADLSVYEDFFACPVMQGPGMPSVHFSMDCLLLPVRDATPWLKPQVEVRAEAALRALKPEKDAFLEQLQQALLKSLYDGSCSLVRVADQLHLSARSLQRRMAERGQTFADLLDKTRARLAGEQVRNLSVSLGEVAQMLGFSDQSAFNRAFRRWYGVSPQQYRRTGCSGTRLSRQG